MRFSSFTIFLAGVLLVSPSLQNTYADAYNSFCPKDSPFVKINTQTVIDSRDKLKGMAIPIADVGDLVNNYNINKLLQSQPGVYLILMIVITVIIFISIWVIWSCFCCCERYEKPRDGWARGCNILGGVALFITLAFLITCIVFIDILNKNFSAAACAIGRIPFDLIDGVMFNEQNFIGLDKISSFVSGMVKFLPQLTQLTANFDNIMNKNIATQSQEALLSLKSFSTEFIGITSADGNGGEAVSAVIQGLTPEINDAILKEFNRFDKTAIAFNKSAQSGKLLGRATFNQGTTSIFQSLATDLTTQVNILQNTLKNSVGPIISFVAYSIGYTPISYWIVLFVLLVVIGMSIAVGSILYLMYQNKNDNCRCGAKSFVIVVLVLTFFLSVASLVLMGASVFSATVCQVIPQILTSTNTSIVPLIEGWGFTIKSDLKPFLSTCAAQNSDGDFSSLFSTAGSITGTPIMDFADGMVAFRSFQVNLTDPNLKSPAIESTLVDWEKYRISTKSNSSTVDNALQTLNGLTNCGNIKFELNTLNCQGVCEGIYQASIPRIPSCSGSEALSIWTNLKSYTTGQDKLLTRMIQRMNTTSTSTPNTSQKRLKTGMLSTVPDFNRILDVIGTMFNPLPTSLVGGFFENANCTIIRSELLNIEEHLCFEFNNSLYLFAVLLIFSVLIVYMASLFYFCGLKCVGERVETMVGTMPGNVPGLNKLDEVKGLVLEENPIY